jgi:two-component system chemotaxis response regulator CheY
MKILIVDDSTAMRRIVQRTLRQAGFGDHTIIEAENGAIALQKVKSENPDLILADWNMPEMTGIDFLKAIRGQGINTCFGFVTSEGTDATRQLAKESGANFLLTKPFTAEDVANALKEYIP